MGLQVPVTPVHVQCIERYESSCYGHTVSIEHSQLTSEVLGSIPGCARAIIMMSQNLLISVKHLAVPLIYRAVATGPVSSVFTGPLSGAPKI